MAASYKPLFKMLIDRNMKKKDLAVLSGVSMATITKMEEPIVKMEIITPKDYLGGIMDLCSDRRGVYHDMQYIDSNRTKLIYTMPLNEIVYDFFDKIKSISKGYASMDYELAGYQDSELVKLDIHISR